MKKLVVGSSVAADKYMRVDFDPEVMPPQRPRKSELPIGLASTGCMDAIGRKMAKFGVQKVELMPSNTGYLQWSAFPLPELTADKYGAAMDTPAGTDSLIIDLRENGGGVPTSVALLASYFFDPMQALGRATLVGARTWGGAHPTGEFRLDDHFLARSPNH